MASFSFRAVLKDHADGPEKIAEKLYPVYNDVTVSSDQGVVWVGFKREAFSFSKAVHTAHEQLTAAGYQIDRIEIDGQELPLLGQLAESDFTVAPDDDTRED